MFKVGLNPYGICYTLGIQGQATWPKDAVWFLDLAQQAKARSIEFHFLHLAASTEAQLDQIQTRLETAKIQPIVSGPWPLNRIQEAFPLAQRLGVKTIRTHLSPFLCGARAERLAEWNQTVQDLRKTLPEVAKRFQDQGLTLAIENHQDFGSQELLDFCDLAGDSVGICLDTGNPLSVGEDPIAFTKKVAPKVRHVHLKDYQAQTTPEGFRLIRCPIGDGCIPLQEVEQILAQYHTALTATLEIGALQSRHIRLLAEDWWQGYQPTIKEQTEACLQTTLTNALNPAEDGRTPAERGEDSETVARYEMEQMMKSIQNMQTLGWLPA